MVAAMTVTRGVLIDQDRAEDLFIRGRLEFLECC